ncbi:endonuclease domain-containing protein [Roseivirga seohaensis]|uniref:endonuclease domain-containing protein n=1 Tax=Roseivirga seohaensis TaxID=1914963 RepID=UPI0030DA4843|tara:strand:- start:56456 stop:56845 length:390 start_codon:yes stop_codon:yes gene_type:complete
MPSNNHYNKHLKHPAKRLRNEMTKAEASLWKYILSKRQVYGQQFRRQRPIDNYIVDFVCLPLNLIIEVDGITHTYEEVTENDKIRQLKLESLGFKIIRFTDEEVLTSISSVYRNIAYEVEVLMAKIQNE